MKLKALSAELSARGVQHKVVLAATTKPDGENPPYIRQRYLSGLNDKRLASVFRVLEECVVGFGSARSWVEEAHKIPKLNFKERTDLLQDLHIKASMVSERLQVINSKVSSFAGGIEYGKFSYISATALRYGDRYLQKSSVEDTHLTGDTVDLFDRVAVNATKILKALRKKLIAEAKRRGYSESKLLEMAREAARLY